MGNSKIMLGDELLIDLTNDTVEPSNLLKGITAHNKAGDSIEGTCEFDADTQDATALKGEILTGKTAYVKGVKVTGEMVNREGVTGTISTKDSQYTIPNGYHDGSGKVSIDTTEQSKIIPTNIKEGVSILGVTGTYSGAGVKAQAKTGKAYVDKANTVLPDAGYDYLSQVEIEKINVTKTPNASGGYTVVIGEKSPV